MTEVIKQRIEHLIDQGFSVDQICKMQGVKVWEVENIYYEKTGNSYAHTLNKMSIKCYTIQKSNR